VRWHHGHVGDRTAASWPPPGAGTITFHLDRAASAAADAAGGALQASPPTQETQASWRHDPDDLVPSLLQDSFSAVLHHVDESPLHSRADVLTFTTSPVEEPLDLAGPVRATLTVGTDGPSAHVYLKLLDIVPDGSAHVLVRGQRLIPGGAPAPVVFDLTHAGYRLRPGHALRLHIASSDYPMYLPHPGTDENPWLAEQVKATTQTLFVGPGVDSHLTLTVVNSDAVTDSVPGEDL
jgi:putative CocE/NonD family hydrolase